MGLDNTQIQPLSEILVIEDQLPKDFFTNSVYEQRLDAAIKASNSLVYTLDDEGEKQAKKDATSINKFSKSFKSFVLAVFREKTGEIQLWKSGIVEKLGVLQQNRMNTLDQFAERRSQKLKDIESLLLIELGRVRAEMEIDSAYYSEDFSFSPLLKLSGTLTPKGALTKKAIDFIAKQSNVELAEQTRIKARHLLLENKCLKAEINPPLTSFHLGATFYASDEEFNSKLDELIEIEISRKEELKAKIIEDQKEANQKKLDDALEAQQDEANRVAIEEAEKKIQEQPKTSAQVTIEVGSNIPQPVPAKKQAVVNGKHQVQIQVTFSMAISDTVTDKSVQDFFLKQLSDKLKSSIDNISTRSL